MSQAIKEKSLYEAAFREFQQRSGRELPAWIERLRESAFDRFEQMGFPTTAAEDWKYTNTAPIARTAFEPVSDANSSIKEISEVEPFIFPEARRSCLVFINGIFRREFSALEGLPAGVVASPLDEALEGRHEELARQYLSRLADYNEQSFTALNTAFLGSSGAFLYFPKDVRVETPVQLLFLADAGEARSAVFPRLLVVTERGSEATIIESYASTGESVYFTNAVIEVAVGENARLAHYKVQRESERAFHIAATYADLARSSAYDLTTITLGAQLSRHGIGVRLAHEGAECWLDGLYIVGTGQHADTHSLIDHFSPHCTSHQLYKGILDGKSRAVFNGKVFVHRDAQQTDAMQTNKNLLLSNEAHVDTKPQLEIYADDVKCAHGATVGQLEEEELFYLMSRGLRPDAARNLLTYGFAEEVVAKIKIGSIKTQLDEAILNRLHARLEG